MPPQDTGAGADFVSHHPQGSGRPPAMSVRVAVPVKLTAAERQRLKKAAYGHKTPHQARVAGTDRAPGDPGQVQRADRRRGGRARGHRAHLAGPVRRRRPAGPGRPQAQRAPVPLHARAGRRGQGPGLPAARRDRGAAVALVVPGTGRRADRAAASPTAISASTVRRWLRRRRAQALAVPVLDLHPRPGLPRQGRRASSTCTPAPTRANPSARTST